MSTELVEERFFIQGKTHSGQKFRPSDWAEMLSGHLCIFAEDKRLCYSEYVKPCIIDGYNSLVVKKSLEQFSPTVYQFIMQFSQDNQLTLKECDEQCPLF